MPTTSVKSLFMLLKSLFTSLKSLFSSVKSLFSRRKSYLEDEHKSCSLTGWHLENQLFHTYVREFTFVN